MDHQDWIVCKSELFLAFFVCCFCLQICVCEWNIIEAKCLVDDSRHVLGLCPSSYVHHMDCFPANGQCSQSTVMILGRETEKLRLSRPRRSLYPSPYSSFGRPWTSQANLWLQSCNFAPTLKSPISILTIKHQNSLTYGCQLKVSGLFSTTFWSIKDSAITVKLL